MYRVLEAIFRRLVLIVTLIVVLPVVGVAVAYFLPRSYQSTASLWALHRYTIIGSTGPESDLYATPADTQTTALTELLQTRDFALKVAKSTDLASTLDLPASVRANPSLLDDALVAEISKNVQVHSQGYNLFVISYTNRSADVAQKIVAAAVKYYGIQSQYLTIAEGQQLLTSYQLQYTQAKKALDTAAKAEADYLTAHPSLAQQTNATVSDPQYAVLHSQTQQTQTKLNTLQQNISSLQDQISQQGQSSSGLFTVIDQPVLATQAVSRTKLFLTAGGVGLGVALLACALYIIILVRRDRAIYTANDLNKIVNASMVMQLPALSPKAVPLFIEQTVLRGA